MVIPESIISLEDFEKLSYADCAARFGPAVSYTYSSNGLNRMVTRRGLLKRGTLINSLTAAAKSVVQGGFIDPTERLNMCRTCDKYENGRCLSCGCFLAAKARIKLERCPEGKWSS